MLLWGSLSESRNVSNLIAAFLLHPSVVLVLEEGGEIGVARCVVGLVLFFLVLFKQGFSYFMSLMEVKLGALMVTFSNSRLAADL